jgi:hypothetical protein
VLSNAETTAGYATKSANLRGAMRTSGHEGARSDDDACQPGKLVVVSAWHRES